MNILQCTERIRVTIKKLETAKTPGDIQFWQNELNWLNKEHERLAGIERERRRVNDTKVPIYVIVNSKRGSG